MPKVELTLLDTLSQVCQRLDFKAKPKPVWVLIGAAEARAAELSGASIRCAFCLGRIKLFKQGSNGNHPHMEHVSAEDARHCVVGYDYDQGVQKESRSPVGKNFGELAEERALLLAEAVRRFRNSQGR